MLSTRHGRGSIFHPTSESAEVTTQPNAIDRRHRAAMTSTSRMRLKPAYTLVAHDAITSIFRLGLLSGEMVGASSALLTLARPEPEDRETWLCSFKEFAGDPVFGVVYTGPNIFFSLPDSTRLGDRIRARRLVPFEIDLHGLLEDEPGLRVRGLELEPYRSTMSDDAFNSRERDLSREDLHQVAARSSTDLWQHHDPEDVDHYASDVPHAVIVTPRIEGKYLRLAGY